MNAQYEGTISHVEPSGGCIVLSLSEYPGKRFAFGETDPKFLRFNPKEGMRVQIHADPGRLYDYDVKGIVGLEASGADRPSVVAPTGELLSAPPAPTKPTEAINLKRSEGRFLTIPLTQIQESAWNPNEMDEQTFHDLLQDMRVGGQYAVNPIDLFAISHDEKGVVTYQIADGHNRFRAAEKAGWKEIRSQVYDMDEDQAKVWNYHKNRERGTINPTKEAKLFQEEAERGRTQDEIAAKFGVSQKHVSVRIASLPIYTVGIKPTHAAEIVAAIKEPEVRETVARVAVKRKLTPTETGEVAKRVQQDISDKPKATKKFVRVKAEQHAKEVKSPQFQPKPDHEFHCPRCRTEQVVFCGGPRSHRVVPVMNERRDEED